MEVNLNHFWVWTRTLEVLRPGASWTLRGMSYDGLTWLDENQTKPTEEEIMSNLRSGYHAQGMYVLKRIRDKLLYNCDWTQLSDAPLSDEKKLEWSTYRQQLRDLPAQYSDYETNPIIVVEELTEISGVTWPSKPS